MINHVNHVICYVSCEKQNSISFISKCCFYKMDHKIVFHKSREHSEMQKNWYDNVDLKNNKTKQH